MQWEPGGADLQWVHVHPKGDKKLGIIYKGKLHPQAEEEVIFKRNFARWGGWEW